MDILGDVVSHYQQHLCYQSGTSHHTSYICCYYFRRSNVLVPVCKCVLPPRLGRETQFINVIEAVMLRSFCEERDHF